MAEATSQLSILVRVRDEASAALSRLSNDVQDLGGSLGFAGDKAGTLAGALAAIGSAAAIKTAIDSFAEAEFKAMRFDAIMAKLPPELHKFKGAILDVADNALLKFGFDNEEAALSIARLLQVTGDAPFAFKAFQAAMDLARFRGIGLDEALQALIISFQGQGRMLKQLGIDVDEHASKETILAAVIKAVGGTAEATSGSLKVMMETVSELIGEFTEVLGAEYAPAMKAAIGWLQNWIKAWGSLRDMIQILQPLLTFLAAFLAVTLVASMVLVIAQFLAWISVGLGMIAVISAIASAFTLFITIWRSGWNEAWKSVQEVGNMIMNFFRSVFDYVAGLFSGLIGRITSSLTGFASGTLGTVRSILGFQHGGIVTRPTLGLLGEAGAEAVIPLSRFGGAGIGSTINIYLQGDFYTDAEVAEKFGNEIARIIKYQLKL